MRIGATTAVLVAGFGIGIISVRPTMRLLAMRSCIALEPCLFSCSAPDIATPPASPSAPPRHLAGNWWLAAWDRAQPAPWNSAECRVTEETLLATETWLAGSPPGSRLIVANHYPVFFPSGHARAPAHGLVNHETVRAGGSGSGARTHLFQFRQRLLKIAGGATSSLKAGNNTMPSTFQGLIMGDSMGMRGR